MSKPSPYELWVEANGNGERYRALMREHGHIVDVEPCIRCGHTFRHRHEIVTGRLIRIDVFGHDDEGGR